MSCGVGRRCGSDPKLLWLWCRLDVALLWLWCRPIATLHFGAEPPHATGVAERKKEKIVFVIFYPAILGILRKEEFSSYARLPCYPNQNSFHLYFKFSSLYFYFFMLRLMQ